MVAHLTRFIGLFAACKAQKRISVGVPFYIFGAKNLFQVRCCLRKRNRMHADHSSTWFGSKTRTPTNMRALVLCVRMRSRESRCCYLFTHFQCFLNQSSMLLHNDVVWDFSTMTMCMSRVRSIEAEEMDRKWFYIVDYCFFFHSLPLHHADAREYVLSRLHGICALCVVAAVISIATQFLPHTIRFSVDWMLRMRYANLNRSNRMHNIRRCTPCWCLSSRPHSCAVVHKRHNNGPSHRINNNDIELEKRPHVITILLNWMNCNAIFVRAEAVIFRIFTKLSYRI